MKSECVLMDDDLKNYQYYSGKELKTMKKVVIYGNKSTAQEAYSQMKYFSDFEVLGFSVDRDYIKTDHLFDLPVVPFDEVEQKFSPEQHAMLIAVGYLKNKMIRHERYLQAKEKGYRLINLVSPKSVIHRENLTGDNCIIGHYTIIPDSARIGNNVIIGSGSNIGHDVTIGDNSILSSGVLIAGSVSIGESCYLSTGCIIRNRAAIGKECVIGAGAIIFENTKDRSVYLGEPARLLPISSLDLPLG